MDEQERLSDFPGPEAREEAPPEAETDTGSEEAASVQDPVRLKEMLEDFRRRNSGLQRRLQQELQARRELEQKVRQLEELSYAATLQSLPPEERLRRLQDFRQQREIGSRYEEIRRLEQELEEKAKVIVAHEFSRRYNIPVEELLAFDTPEEMERFAKRAGGRRVQAPRFEGAEPSPAPRERPKSLDEAVEAFRRAARRRGLL